MAANISIDLFFVSCYRHMQGLKPTHADQILTLKWLESWLDYSAEKIYTCVPVVAKSLTSKAMTVNYYILKVQEIFHLYSRRDLIRKWTLDVNNPSCRSAAKSSPICPDIITKDLGCKTHIKIIYGAFQIHVPATSHVWHTYFGRFRCWILRVNYQHSVKL